MDIVVERTPQTASPIEGAWRHVVLSVSLCPRLTLTSRSPSSSRTLPLSSSAITRVESICPGNRGFQYDSTTGTDACFRMTSMTSRVCDEPRVWKSFLNRVYAKEMIAVAMGRVDRRQILATPRDPVGEFLVLIDCDFSSGHRILRQAPIRSMATTLARTRAESPCWEMKRTDTLPSPAQAFRGASQQTRGSI
jgi:hypothetical protein